MDEKLIKFLGLVNVMGWRQPPKGWNEQLRQALADQLVTAGFGGKLKLTDAGHDARKSASAQVLTPSLPGGIMGNADRSRKRPERSL